MTYPLPSLMIYCRGRSIVENVSGDMIQGEIQLEMSDARRREEKRRG